MIRNLRVILGYVQRRLAERSTRVALVTLAGTLGMSLAADHLELVAALVGLALVIVAPDGGGSNG